MIITNSQIANKYLVLSELVNVKFTDAIETALVDISKNGICESIAVTNQIFVFAKEELSKKAKQ